LNSSALLATTDQLRQRGVRYCYSVYGLRIATTIPLSVPEVPGESGCDVEVVPGDPAFFADRARNFTFNSDWAQAHRLPGRWVYARLAGLFDFLLSPDGSRIFFRPLGEFSGASFETYLLGLVMKAVLIKKDIHSLHASAVMVDGRAIAFLGFSGFGKSSLAASFVGAGHALLTDDVLRLDENDGRFWAFPGPANLKLLPESSLGLDLPSVGVPMDPDADKYLFPVPANLRCAGSVPLAAIYCVAGPEAARGTDRISIRALDPREGLPEILYGIQRDAIVEADRATNPFHTAKRIVASVSLRWLACPWDLALLPAVRDAILADLRSVPLERGEKSVRSV
jgi:hypothetical protein